MRLFPATEPFAALAITLLGRLPRTSQEYEYILVICDQFTKVTRAVPLRDITALDVFSAFLDKWVASYGIPDSVLSDIADPRVLSWWTETDFRTDSLHQSDTPLGLTWCS